MGYLRKHVGHITITSGTSGTYNFNANQPMTGMIRGLYFEDNGGPSTQDLVVQARFTRGNHTFTMEVYAIDRFQRGCIHSW